MTSRGPCATAHGLGLARARAVHLSVWLEPILSRWPMSHSFPPVPELIENARAERPWPSPLPATSTTTLSPSVLSLFLHVRSTDRPPPPCVARVGGGGLLRLDRVVPAPRLLLRPGPPPTSLPSIS